jgi:hypothetical protein
VQDRPSGDDLARLVLIVAGVLLLYYCASLLAPTTRTVTTAEHNFSITVNATQAPAESSAVATSTRTTPPNETATVASSTRTTSTATPDGRPSDAALATIAAIGTLLVIAGAFYNRKFAFTAPGGWGLNVDAVAKVTAHVVRRIKETRPDLLDNPAALSKVIGLTVDKWQRRAPTAHAPRLKGEYSGMFGLAYLRHVPTPDTLDLLTDESVQEVTRDMPAPSRPRRAPRDPSQPTST